jgi:hypothetical protein
MSVIFAALVLEYREQAEDEKLTSRGAIIGQTAPSRE